LLFDIVKEGSCFYNQKMSHEYHRVLRWTVFLILILSSVILCFHIPGKEIVQGYIYIYINRILIIFIAASHSSLVALADKDEQPVSTMEAPKRLLGGWSEVKHVGPGPLDATVEAVWDQFKTRYVS
jgi:hypothetical protein